MIKPWTFMFYNAGQGQLARMATHSLRELERVGSDQNTDVVALNYRENTSIGRHSQFEGGSTYHIQRHGAPRHRSELGSLLSCALASPKDLKSPLLDRPVAPGDSAKISQAETLKAFLLDSMKRFPAQHFALAITGHGAAFQGQAITRGPAGRAAISNDELGRVLREVREQTGRGVDLVNLNTCYSANLESLYSLKGATSTVVASQAALAVGTQPFAKVLAEVQQQLKAGKSVQPADLGRLFVQEAAVQPLHQLYSPTLTALDANSLGELGQAVAELQSQCMAAGVAPAQLRELIGKSVSVDFAQGVELTDLGSLASQIGECFPQLRPASEAVKQALSKTVLSEQHAIPEDESRLSRLVRKLPGLVGEQRELTGATGMTVFWNGSEKQRLACIEESDFGREHPIQKFMEYLRG